MGEFHLNQNHVTMLAQVFLSCFLPLCLARPDIRLVNQGPQAGPLTAAYGDLVQTPRGLASLHLEGFSEDLDQDGYVDPVVQAPAVAAVAAPVAAVHHAPAVAPVAAVHHAPAVHHA